jgi:hypothetical protein
MTPTRSLRHAVKQQHYLKIVELAIKTRTNREFLLQQDDDFWTRISRNCFDNDRFLTEFCDKLDWNVISASKISIATASAFATKLNWTIVSRQAGLQQEFIYKLGDYLDLKIVSANYNNLSVAIQQKYAASLNWNFIVISHTMLKEWFESPIADYIDFDLVAKYKHLNKWHFNTPQCMSKIDLNVYLRNLNKVSDTLILYCLREGRVQELKAVSGNIVWADHMFVFDDYPALAETLRTDWATVSAWNGSNAPPIYFIRHHLTYTFEQDFVNNNYWDKFINYATSTTYVASAAFALLVFDNFKSRVDWSLLQFSDRFINLAVLYRMNGPIINLNEFNNDAQVWRAYGKFVNNDGNNKICEHIIPINMNVRDAYFKMILIQPCASQQEHDEKQTCDRFIALNGGKEAMLNYNLLSKTQPLCPFNMLHLENVNVQTYRRENPYFIQDIYEKMVVVQMNIN